MASTDGEQVDHPAHYGDGTYETINVIEAWSADWTGPAGFNLGNAIKYISRAGKKDEAKTIEDLRKAAWYVQHEIDRLDPPKVTS